MQISGVLGDPAQVRKRSWLNGSPGACCAGPAGAQPGPCRTAAGAPCAGCAGCEGLASAEAWGGSFATLSPTTGETPWPRPASNQGARNASQDLPHVRRSRSPQSLRPGPRANLIPPPSPPGTDASVPPLPSAATRGLRDRCEISRAPVEINARFVSLLRQSPCRSVKRHSSEEEEEEDTWEYKPSGPRIGGNEQLLRLG